MKNEGYENMKKIESWYEPVDELREQANFICEMSREDHGFLCGALKSVMPKKILEIGVAEGGTTSIIMNAVKMLDISPEFYSVDLNERFYHDDSLQTGYENERLRTIIEYYGHHEFLFGKTIAGQIQAIGNDIDFVIIDTTHSLPGELLDFLTVLPYCKKNAFIILHDTNLNYIRARAKEKDKIRRSREMIATKVLFTSVVADKYINYINANIAGFFVNKDTNKYIDDVFYGLTLSWSYILDKWMAEEYRNIFTKHYSSEQVECFDIAVKNNKCICGRYKFIQSENYVGDYALEYDFPYEEIPAKTNIILYGAGKVGNCIYSLLQNVNYCNVVSWVDKNYLQFNQDIKVESPECIKEKTYDYILVAVERDALFEEIQEELCSIYGCNKNIIIGPISRY